MARKWFKTNKADVTAFLNRVKFTAATEVRATRDKTAKDIAKKIYDRSQQFVPLDKGPLKASGKIVKIETGKYQIVYDAPYAFFVHENMRTDEPLDARNGPAQFGASGNAKSYTTSGTGPKYLERAADLEAEQNKVIKFLRDALGRFRKKLTLRGK